MKAYSSPFVSRVPMRRMVVLSVPTSDLLKTFYPGTSEALECIEPGFIITQKFIQVEGSLYEQRAANCFAFSPGSLFMFMPVR
jgi:hypothetical protein